ncbi:MAG: hypothetical protein ACOC1X_03295, partial [Promethearchaeota archaeon]
ALLETPRENASIISSNLDGKGVLFTKLFSTFEKSTTFIPILSKKDEAYFSEELKYLGNFNTEFIIGSRFLKKIEISDGQIERFFYQKEQNSELELELELGLYNIDDISYENHSLFLGLILNKETLELFNEASKNNLITSFITEKGQTTLNKEFTTISSNKIDIILFSEMNDPSERRSNDSTLDKIDEDFKVISRMRVYLISEKNLEIRINQNGRINYTLSVDKKLRDRKLIINHFFAGFLIKINELIKNKESLQNYLKIENLEALYEILNKCIKFGESFVQEKFLKTID